MSILVLCKFTPLGFETPSKSETAMNWRRVNLPRWGLKQECADRLFSSALCVNLPRWGLKHPGRGDATAV